MNQTKAAKVGAEVFGAVFTDLFNHAEQLIKRLALDCSAHLLESLAKRLEAGEELTPRYLRAVARDLHKEANK